MGLGNDGAMDTPPNSPIINGEEPSQFPSEEICQCDLNVVMQELGDSNDMQLSDQCTALETSFSQPVTNTEIRCFENDYTVAFLI